MVSTPASDGFSPKATIAIDPDHSLPTRGRVVAGSFAARTVGHWAAVNSGLTSLTIHALAIDSVPPTTLYAGTRGDALGGGVFRLITDSDEDGIDAAD